MKYLPIIICSLLFVFPKLVICENTGRYKNEIEASSKNLQALQKSIKEKRLEKEKCLLDEKCTRSELSRIDKELGRLQRKCESLRKEIKKTEAKLNQSEKELKLAGWEKKQWINTLGTEVNKWYKIHHSYFTLFNDKVTEHLRFEAMRQKRAFVGNALNKEAMSREAIAKWQAAKNKLGELKNQQENTLKEQAGVKEQKKEILKTTIGKRLAAEAEINKLTESAKALEQMIVKIEKERKKTEQESLERKRFKEKKKHLPWPVEGQIVVKFGKSKHPELNTYVISNGIKIKAAENSEVKAVGKGEILFCGEFRSYGQMIIIDHSGGFYTIYGQLNDIYVQEGQKVLDGGTIGKLGSGQQSILYFEVRSESHAEDPELWLK